MDMDTIQSTRHIKNLESLHIRCLQKILGLSWEDRVQRTETLNSTNSTSMNAAGGPKRRNEDFTKDLLKLTAIKPGDLELWQKTD